MIGFLKSSQAYITKALNLVLLSSWLLPSLLMPASKPKMKIWSHELKQINNKQELSNGLYNVSRKDEWYMHLLLSLPGLLLSLVSGLLGCFWCITAATASLRLFLGLPRRLLRFLCLERCHWRSLCIVYWRDQKTRLLSWPWVETPSNTSLFIAALRSSDIK